MTFHRRDIMAGAGALALTGALPSAARAAGFPSKRPAPGDRKFTSPAIEAEIARVKAKIADPELAWMFENCYPNTLDTTVDVGTVDGKPDTFVLTGDIHAMWLRDSSAQVQPYIHLVGRDPKLKRLFQGLIQRQARCILIDPYANAFMKDPAATSNLPQVAKVDMPALPGLPLNVPPKLSIPGDLPALASAVPGAVGAPVAGAPAAAAPAPLAAPSLLSALP